MKKSAIFILFISMTYSITSYSQAVTLKPPLSAPETIPNNIRSLLVEFGTIKSDANKSLTWNQNGEHHYFLQIQDEGGGCAIVDVNSKTSTYRTLDSYGQCQVILAPKVVDLTGNGSAGIVITLRLQSNGTEDTYTEQTNAYIYVREKSEFCKNDDAGSFANGTRVANSVLKFGPSDCR
ncbi:hypothetical protein ACFFJT_16510 [Dyella flava]|uniref:Uncharacterized protein n=1 Tax=Dyella flava TaxID=1920170 RepID=A0ABS2K4R4_9GAMM|nr:hypothetical protein [Dyella flava]MBM7125869.1 hypothetical protein [Dyella flava]GLQ48613.1 hypothetical protein GCM10010872_00620 [Dyella flava]